MNSTTQNYEQLVSTSAVIELEQELRLSYSKLYSFNAFSKAGDKFDAGDWGFCVAIFGLGYLTNYIQNRLDSGDKALYQNAFSNAQSQFIRNIFGEANSTSIISKCWDAINSISEADLFFKTGAIASEDKEGARKHLITAFAMKYKILNYESH